VAVKIVRERVQFIGGDGKLATESVKDYTRKTVRKKFALFDDFLNTWTKAEQKIAVLKRWKNRHPVRSIGRCSWPRLRPIDLICHVAYDEPPLTRKERAQQVRNGITLAATATRPVT